MTWAIVGAVVLVALVIVAWLGRSRDTPLRHDAARSEMLRSLLAARGVDAQVAPKAPSGIPDFALPLDWGFDTRAGAQAIAGNTRWLLYDADVTVRSVAGCNSVGKSTSGEGVIGRHTVALLETDSLTLPHFTVVPNVRRLIGDLLPARLQEAGLADSKVARAATWLSDKLGAIDEHGRALPFPAYPDFEAAFRVTGDDADAVSALFDGSTVRLLMEHPWAIIEGRGACLAASRNVAPAYSVPDRPEHGREGLLSRESASELLTFSQRLAERLQSRR